MRFTAENGVFAEIRIQKILHVNLLLEKEEEKSWYGDPRPRFSSLRLYFGTSAERRNRTFTGNGVSSLRMGLGGSLPGVEKTFH